MVRCREFLVAMSVGVFCWADSTVFAGLSGSPISYLIEADDGKHILVLLAEVPIEEDTADLLKRPDGQTAHLRNIFPKSGLYKNGTDTPIWTVDWHDGLCFLSPNARHLVRVRHYGDFDHPNDDVRSWAVQFYADGELIKRYGVDELIDYPSLIPHWYRSILRDDYVEGDLEFKDHLFTMHTFTNEQYVFDITTGEIVEAFRFWRTAVWCTAGTVAIASIFMCAFVLYKNNANSKHRRLKPETTAEQESE